MKSDNFKNFISLKTNQGYRNPDKAVPTVGFLIFFLAKSNESLSKLGAYCEILSVRGLTSSP